MTAARNVVRIAEMVVIKVIMRLDRWKKYSNMLLSQKAIATKKQKLICEGVSPATSLLTLPRRAVMRTFQNHDAM